MLPLPQLLSDCFCPPGVVDSSVDEESNLSVFPANTNVLYVGLQVSGAGIQQGLSSSYVVVRGRHIVVRTAMAEAGSIHRRW
jgi:hypothetical protein